MAVVALAAAWTCQGFTLAPAASTNAPQKDRTSRKRARPHTTATCCQGTRIALTGYDSTDEIGAAVAQRFDAKVVTLKELMKSRKGEQTWSCAFGTQSRCRMYRTCMFRTVVSDVPSMQPATYFMLESTPEHAVSLITNVSAYHTRRQKNRQGQSYSSSRSSSELRWVGACRLP